MRNEYCVILLNYTPQYVVVQFYDEVYPLPLDKGDHDELTSIASIMKDRSRDSVRGLLRRFVQFEESKVVLVFCCDIEHRNCLVYVRRYKSFRAAIARLKNHFGDYLPAIREELRAVGMKT